ncbi:hypothetical protein F4777DRAFT_397733 [Nemania sp. FL0916]|nr:hypothetical protein F4777DRAFT_397733 [Nemania sp. FL0916]
MLLQLYVWCLVFGAGVTTIAPVASRYDAVSKEIAWQLRVKYARRVERARRLFCPLPTLWAIETRDAYHHSPPEGVHSHVCTSYLGTVRSTYEDVGSTQVQLVKRTTVVGWLWGVYLTASANAIGRPGTIDKEFQTTLAAEAPVCTWDGPTELLWEHGSKHGSKLMGAWVSMGQYEVWVDGWMGCGMRAHLRVPPFPPGPTTPNPILLDPTTQPDFSAKLGEDGIAGVLLCRKLRVSLF